MIEQFTIQPLTPDVVYILAVALVVIGIVLLVANVLLYNRFRDRPWGGKMVGIGIGVNSKYVLVILGIVLIVVGGFVYGVAFSASSPSVVTVGDGYINVNSANFVSLGALLGVSGNKNVTSEEIANAFVGQIGSGNFNLHKQHATDFDDTYVGKYVLGNGATAYVATINATSLMIELKNGEYLIVGTSDTQALVDSFSQNVYPLIS
ncbi:MAG: hypothetical protein FWG55_03775 [Candidatus Bathyarchaeota archaeon]|nr:hypothetical protein [Candidatus Termiticorpusculum sp.]